MRSLKRKCWICVYTSFSLMSALAILYMLPTFDREVLFGSTGFLRFSLFGTISLFCFYETISFRNVKSEIGQRLRELFFVMFLMSAQHSGFGIAGLVYNDKILWGFLFLSTAPVGLMFLVSGFRFIREIKRNL